jgi:DNA repair protein RecN (Recombination protein N)
MLLELTISNFIIIDQISVKFHPNLNILTGETGAGKSILIQAINLALGQKMKNGRDKIRGDKSTIELIFDYNPADFSTLGIERYDDGQGLLVVSREIYSSGKSVSRLNGQVIKQSLLKNITQRLIDVHGQHMHQTLLDEKTHLNTIDLYGGLELYEQKKKVEFLYERHQNLFTERDTFLQTELNQDVDYLEFQLNEIDDARIDIENDLLLEEEFNRLEHLEDYLEAVSDSTEHFEKIINLIVEIKKSIDNVASFDQTLSEFNERLSSVQIELDDLSYTISDKAQTMEFDPDRYKFLEKRIDMLNLLMKKYGSTLQEVLTHHHEIKEKITRVRERDNLLKELNQSIEDNYLKFVEASLDLSDRRQKVANKFSLQIENEIRSLNLPDICFQVSMKKRMKEDRYKVSNDGIDDVFFRISTNKGLQPMPLSEVASGGEISRVMLGIKAVLSRTDLVDTMIFDEIDTGISGETAFLVGRKMGQLSKEKQIIAITHLSQIAAAGDRHFKIEKLEGESSLIPLTEDERIEEIARIISGQSIDQQAIENSRSLIRQARLME